MRKLYKFIFTEYEDTSWERFSESPLVRTPRQRFKDGYFLREVNGTRPDRNWN